MANRIFKQIRGTLDNEVVILAGAFKPNGSSAIDEDENTSNGWSVAYTSTGKYTITLDDVYSSYLSCTATIAQTTAGDQYVAIGAIDVTSAKTVEIFNWDVSGNAIADVAAAAGSMIHFCLVLKNSSV